MKKIFIATLGCKVNQFESASFKTGFEQRGMSIVTASKEADVIVVNTCAVTAGAGAQSRRTIRQALRGNPTAKIIITGCYAEIAARELAAAKELQDREYSLIGNSKKDDLVAGVINGESAAGEIIMGAIDSAQEICRLPVRRFGQRARAYLRIQDGCESFCTYCIVPYTRGPSRSLPVAEVIEQAKIFAAEGHKEIVLTGIHLGNYGKDLNDSKDLISLLDQLTHAVPDVAYRISSLEPLEISESLLSLMRERKNIQPHLHIPLQSGNDEILRKMNRRYTLNQFEHVIDLCRKYLPDAALGVDILAGFPGETEAQFISAEKFLRSLSFSYLHVFPYSIRPGTVAASFKGHVSKKIKDLRVAGLRLLSDEKKRAFYQSQLGRIRPVLVEGCRTGNGLLKGFTDNYIAVHFAGSDRLLNSTCLVRLTLQKDDWVIGEGVERHED